MILLQARLNEKASIKNISDQIDIIQKGLSTLKISLDLSDFKTQLEKTFGEFEKATKKMNTSTGTSAIVGEMEKYKKSIANVTHEYKLGLKTQTEYINAMQKAVFDKSGGYSSDFLNLEMKEQERIVREINAAIRERDHALKTEYATQVAIGKEIDKQEKVYATIQAKKESLRDITVQYGQYDPSQYSALIGSFDKIDEALRNNKISASDARVAISKLAPEIKSFEVEAKKASDTTNSFSDRLTRFVQFHLVGEALRQTKVIIKDMVQDVKALDASLVELQKVSDLSGESLKSFTYEAFLLGDTVARTGKEVVDAATTFKRAGFSIGESLDLSKTALVMTNVAENIKDVEDASSSMIAVMRGYGMETSKAMHIVDAFNEVSNTQAINFDQLAEGATRISGVMNQQGNSFEQMLGLITGGTEVLRNVEKVSTGLQTLTLRISGVSEETGTVTEESTRLVAKMGDEFERFAGIKLTDAQDQMRSTYEILEDMARVFPTLDKNTRQYLTQLAAGQRQANVMQAILDNWENVEKATKSALNSQGSALKEQEAYLDSIEGKTKKLQSAMQSLAITTINSDFVKGIIDATTAVVKLVDNLGGLVPVLTAISGLLVIIKASAISETIVAIGAAFKGLSVALGLTAASATAAGTATMAFVPIVGAIAIAVAGAVAAFNHFSKATERAKQKVEKLKTELNDLNANTQTVKDLAQQYDELSRLKEAHGLNNEQQAEFTRIQNELKTLIPTVNGYFDSQGNFILDQSEKMETLVKQQNDYLKAKREELALASKADGGNTIKKYDAEVKEYEKLTTLAEDYKKWISEGNVHMQPALEETEKALKDLGSTHKETIEEMNTGIINISASTEEWTKLTQDQENAIRKYLSSQDDAKLREWYSGLISGSKSASEFVKELLKVPEVQNEIKMATESANESMGNQAKRFSYTADELSELTKSFKESTSTLQSLNGALQELDKNHSLSSSTVTGLIDKYPDLLKHLDNESDMRQYLTDKIAEQEKVHKQVLFNMLQYDTEYYNERIRGNEHLINEIKRLYDVDLKNFNSLAEAKAAVEKRLINALGNAWARMYANNLDKFERQMGVLDSRIKQGDIQSEKLMMQAHAAKTAVDAIRDASKFEEIVVDFVAPGATLLGQPKSKSSSSKSNLPKYLTQGFDDAMKEILSKSDKLEREIEQANAKILNAQLLGNTEEELALQKQLEGMYDSRIELEKEKSIALIGLRKKVSTELGKQNLDVLKGINLESITEKQLADINRKIDEQIDKANKAKNDKLANLLKIQQDMINEHLKAILDANNNINSISLNVRKLENESIEKSIELLERKYEIESAISSQKTKDLEYEQMLYEKDSQEYIDIERKKLDVIHSERQRAEDMYNTLREDGYGSEMEIVKKYHDLWYEYNVKIRQMQMETAKRNKDNELKNLKEKQVHTEQLISMTMDMLRSQYQEERELIEKNSKAKQDALNKELEGYRKIINERKKALQDEVKKEDYQEKLEQYNKELSDMKSQAVLLGKDETAVAEYEKLLEDIVKKESELKKYQRDYNLGLQQESLDKELSQYEDKIKSEIDKLEDQKKDELSVIDRTLKNEVRLREEAIRLIERKNKNLFNQLNKWAEENGTKTKEEIEKAWNGAYDAISEYNNGQLDVLDTLTLIADKIKEVENSSWTDWSYDSIDNNGSTPVNRPSNKPSSGNSSNGDNKPDSGLSQKGREQLNQQKYLHQQMLIAIETNNEGLKKWIREERKKWGLNPNTGAIVKQFHTGINAGRIDGLKADEVVVKALNDEWFITNGQMENLKKNLNSLSGGRGVGDIEISIDALMKDVKIDKGVNENELAKKMSDNIFKQVKEAFKIYGLRK